MEEGVILRNRLAVATNVWRDHIREPLPKIPPGSPDEQIQFFEMTLVDRLAASATPSNANDVAERTWDIVHDRSDDDPVKVKVVALQVPATDCFLWGLFGSAAPVVKDGHKCLQEQ
ncbi:MAG: hypothetical protein NT122_06895 [Solirubrobacterales bacterium]|nr:hypothetical protein [Solirubrobacterales bacterium]